MIRNLITLIVVLASSVCFADSKTRTYYNSNSSIQRREVMSGNSVRQYDRRGCYSGEFRKSGNSLTQTNKGFRSSTLRK